MTEDQPDEARTCIRCDAPLPDDRSVCPACGTLQPSRPRAADPAGPADEVDPMATPPSTPVAAGRPPSFGAPAVAEPDQRAAGPRTRSPLRMVLVVLIVLACIAGLVAGAIRLDRDDRAENSTPASTTTTARPGDDGRATAIRSFCSDPGPITGTDEPVAVFEPGKGAIAFAELPQPISSTAEPEELVVQAGPTVGEPGLRLDDSVTLTSLALCFDATGMKATKSTCDYELTNSDEFGQEATAELGATTYRVELRSLATGKVLTKGTITTPVDACPEVAFIDDGRGVSNPLTQEQVLAWIGEHLPGGIPR